MPRSEMNVRANFLSWLVLYSLVALQPIRHVLEAKTLHEFWPRYTRESFSIPVILLVVSALFVLLRSRRSLAPHEMAEARRACQQRRSMGWKAIALMLLKVNSGALGAWGALAYCTRPTTSPLHFWHYLLAVFLPAIYATLAQVGTLWRFDHIVLNSHQPTLSLPE